MRIDNSFVGMESARNAVSFTTFSAGTYAISNVLQGSEEKGNKNSFQKLLSGWADSTSDLGSLGEGLRYTNKGTYAVDEADRMDDPRRKLQKIREQCVMYLLDLLLGIHSRNSETYAGAADDANAKNQDESSDLSQKQGVLISRNFSYLHSEYETTSFNTTGTVHTKDGRDISFGISVEMSRSFTQYYEQKSSLGVFCDPLVINLDDNITSLSDQKFYFDLDSDGEMDNISMLNSGSGFLALDKNGDGKINDGSELFGAKSGDGFRDLAAYDEDGDGWIDEDDSIFDKLRIWVKDASGKDTLYTLKDAGVGAICLQSQETSFSLNSLTNNDQYGRIARTGMFLFENGHAGTVQHVDLVK